MGTRTCLCVRERELACMYVRECACLCGWRISVCRSPPGSLRKQLSSSVRLLIVILPRMCKELFFVLRSIRQKWVWTSIPRNRRRWRDICSCCWTLHHPRRYAAAHDINGSKTAPTSSWDNKRGREAVQALESARLAYRGSFRITPICCGLLLQICATPSSAT